MSTRVQFPGRSDLIREVQRTLGLVTDGLDGPATIQRIGETLGLSLNLVGRVRGLDFPGRRDAVLRIQQSLNTRIGANLRARGVDGPGTWAAITEWVEAYTGKDVLPDPVSDQGPVAPGNFKETHYTTPHVSRGRTNERQGVVLHHAAGYFQGTISWIQNPNSKVSYHCLISEEGDRASFNSTTDVLWHAGRSSWRGRSGCNGFTVGLAFVGNTNTGARRKNGPGVTEAEVRSAVEWIATIGRPLGWTAESITGHRIVSPGRKDDPSQEVIDIIKREVKNVL